MDALGFTREEYAERRRRLRAGVRAGVPAGLILLPGNRDAACNYPANGYPFRQDSTFLYFFGIDRPGLAGLLDVEEGRDGLYGNDPTLEDIVWTGPQASVREGAEAVGTEDGGGLDVLGKRLREALAQGRKVHLLPPYRGDHWSSLESLLGAGRAAVERMISIRLIDAVIALRSRKSAGEIGEIENALAVTGEAFAIAAQAIRPGRAEQEVMGRVAGVAASHGRALAYPIICTVRGERLHNHHHGNRMERGQLLLLDAGAESPGHYASDITRTFPVGGRFTPEQKDIHQIVHRAQSDAIAAIAPGKPYRDIHLQAAAVIASGLKDMGLFKGKVEDLVAQGVHALCFPHGLGHLLGLDVHDMEGLGEDRVGYPGAEGRSEQFGLAHLRLARALEPGFVLTVEPGIYFIPALIDAWRSQGKFTEYIDYSRLEAFRSFGGIRIEDDVLVTEGRARVLGNPIPKAWQEIESLLN